MSEKNKDTSQEINDPKITASNDEIIDASSLRRRMIEPSDRISSDSFRSLDSENETIKSFLYDGSVPSLNATRISSHSPLGFDEYLKGPSSYSHNAEALSNRNLSTYRIRLEEENVKLKRELKDAQSKYKEANLGMKELQDIAEKLRENEKSHHVIKRIHSQAEEFYMADR